MFIPLFLVAAVIVARLLPLAGDHEGLAVVANLSPLIALALWGGARFPRRWGLLLLLGAILISDMVLNASQGVSIVGVYTLISLAFYAVIALAGMRLRSHRRSLPIMLGATVVGAVAFYLVSNTASFFMLQAYPRSFEGWLQCMTTGLPPFPPTWTFFVKSLASNAVFTAILWCVFEMRAPAGEVKGAVSGGGDADDSVPAS